MQAMVTVQTLTPEKAIVRAAGKCNRLHAARAHSAVGWTAGNCAAQFV